MAAYIGIQNEYEVDVPGPSPSGSFTHLWVDEDEILCLARRDGSAPKIPIRGAAVADLNQTISNPPTQAEVQAITDKIDALLAVMRTAGTIAT